MIRIRPVLMAFAIVGGIWPACAMSSENPAPTEISETGPLAAWQAYIAEASKRFGIPAAWIEAVIIAESGGQTMRNGRPVTSPAGAMGLMQLMPKTWQDMRNEHDLGNDPYDPRDNIMAGTAYLRAMYDRYGYPGMFAAYNAGPTIYERSLTGAKLPKETLDYLAKVTRNPTGIRSGFDIFVRLKGSQPKTNASGSGALFVPLSDGRQVEN